MVQSLSYWAAILSLLSPTGATFFAERRSQVPLGLATLKPVHGDGSTSWNRPYKTEFRSEFEFLSSQHADDATSGPGLSSWEPINMLDDFVPELKDLSTTMYTKVKHPFFPQHSVRIKKTTGWCDDSVE